MIHFAPLQGYTDPAYICLHHRHYGGVDCYHLPFVRVEKGKARRQDMRRLQSGMLTEVPVCAQIICADADEMHILLSEIAECGMHRVDINMGCPFPMQTNHGRGAALVADRARLSQIATEMREWPQMQFSVKTRLGLLNCDEWQKGVQILNDMPLVEVCIHPRTATQMYGGELHLHEFRDFASALSHPVIYNGDIISPEQIGSVYDDFPGIAGVMIGRGLLGRPSLAEEYAEGETHDEHRRMSTMMDMHDELLAIYSDSLCGDKQILNKIKPFWDFIAPPLPQRVAKAIRKARTLQAYKEAIAYFSGQI